MFKKKKQKKKGKTYFILFLSSKVEEDVTIL